MDCIVCDMHKKVDSITPATTTTTTTTTIPYYDYTTTTTTTINTKATTTTSTTTTTSSSSSSSSSSSRRSSSGSHYDLLCRLPKTSSPSRIPPCVMENSLPRCRSSIMYTILPFTGIPWKLGMRVIGEVDTQHAQDLQTLVVKDRVQNLWVCCLAWQNYKVALTSSSFHLYLNDTTNCKCLCLISSMIFFSSRVLSIH